jgi:hypothetical protein
MVKGHDLLPNLTWLLQVMASMVQGSSPGTYSLLLQMYFQNLFMQKLTLTTLVQTECGQSICLCYAKHILSLSCIHVYVQG